MKLNEKGQKKIIDWAEGLIRAYRGEEVVEYDSKVWNEYPKVKPPKEGWYRAVDDVWRGALFWDGVEWKYLGGDIYLADDFMKFKPWDDEE